MLKPGSIFASCRDTSLQSINVSFYFFGAVNASDESAAHSKEEEGDGGMEPIILRLQNETGLRFSICNCSLHACYTQCYNYTLLASCSYTALKWQNAQ